jgi:hypothetical protein
LPSHFFLQGDRKKSQREGDDPLHRAIRVTTCALLSVVTSFAAAQEQHCCEPYGDEPRIKFLDDLLGGFREASRDPYEERIETERHDFTQSTKTVGRGVAQLEAGYTYFYNDEDDEIEQSHATPEMLLRLGLSDDIEFRLRWNYTWRFIDEANNADSAQDLNWSFKLGLTDQECWTPESALQIRGTAPTGGSDWTTGRVEFGLDYIYGWELSERLTLYGSTGFGTNGLGDFSLLPEEPASDHFIVWSQSVALGADLTERTTMYAEYFGLFSHALADEFSINVFNVGVDYYVTDDFVVDVRAGVGLSPDADDFFSGIGGGYRF